MDSKKNTHLRDASFSSYLAIAEENFVQKLVNSDQFFLPVITSSQETPCPISLERTKTKEGEISVFGAEKYYNMKLEDDGSKIINITANNNGYKKGNQIDLHRMKPNRRPGTPSASSEASWNSQTALLRSFPRNPALSKLKRVNGRGFFTGFSCSGSCSDKKSVHIDTNFERGTGCGKEFCQIDQNSIMLDGRKKRQPRYQVKDELHCPSLEKVSIGSKREEYFAFPILNPGMQNLSVKRQLEEKRSKEEESRKSLEVFGSHMLKKGDIAMNLERKLSMLTWDAIPNAPILPTTSDSSQVYEDIESDASSDLFEIENLSGSGQPLFTRQTSDGMSSCMTPTTLYEPSESSIEWRVVTASAAADFSVLSHDEEKLAENVKAPGLTSTASKVDRTKSIMDKESQRSRPSGILGCRSHKAVSVAETACISNEKLPVRKLQADNKVKILDFPSVQHAFSSREFPPIRSPRASIPISAYAVGNV